MSDPTQRCPRCTLHLPLDAFPERYRGKPGNYCTGCAREYQLAYQRGRPKQLKPVIRCAMEGCVTRVREQGARCAPCRRPAPAPRTPSAGYRAVHKRISTQKGSAAQHMCAHWCGQRARDWAYDHADPDEVSNSWKSRMVRYSLNPAHYIALCRACHLKFDGANPANMSSASSLPEGGR